MWGVDKYSGPYQVLERGNKVWKLQVGERVKVVSRDRVKPHLGSVAPQAAVPPTRGRPRMASVARQMGPDVLLIELDEGVSVSVMKCSRYLS